MYIGAVAQKLGPWSRPHSTGMCSSPSLRSSCGARLPTALSPRRRPLGATASPRTHQPPGFVRLDHRFNETLMRENELFESHLNRVNPQLLMGDDDAQGKNRRKSVNPAKKAQAALAPEQKYEIASQEMEEVRDEIEATKGCAAFSLPVPSGPTNFSLPPACLPSPCLSMSVPLSPPPAPTSHRGPRPPAPQQLGEAARLAASVDGGD